MVGVRLQHGRGSRGAVRAAGQLVCRPCAPLPRARSRCAPAGARGQLAPARPRLASALALRGSRGGGPRGSGPHRHGMPQPGTLRAADQPGGAEPPRLLHRERSGTEHVPLGTADDGALHQVLGFPSPEPRTDFRKATLRDQRDALPGASPPPEQHSPDSPTPPAGTPKPPATVRPGPHHPHSRHPGPAPPGNNPGDKPGNRPGNNREAPRLERRGPEMG